MQEKNKPIDKTHSVKTVREPGKAAEIANTLYNDHDTTRWNSTSGKLEDAKGNPVEPHDYLKKQKTVKDGLGNSVRDYISNPAENRFERKDDLVHESPLPVGMPREPKIHTPAYRRKYPERYGHKYTSKLEQAAFPIPGTAPSEKRDSKSITRNELKYLKSKDRNLDHQFIDTTVKPWVRPEPEPIPEPQFDSWKLPVEQDLEKGLGSFFKYPKAYAKK